MLSMACRSRLHVHEEKSCDLKLTNKAWIAPEQRIDRTFEFQVQAISSEKLPLMLHAVVVFTTIAPIIGGDDDNLSRHFFNDHVRGVIERDTLALAANMTMAEIFRPHTTTTSPINHLQAIFEFENVQLELKQRLIVYDACVYVKPQQSGVDVSGNEDFSNVVAADQDGGGAQGHTTGKVEEVGRPSKMGQIMGWACQSLKPQILQVVYGNGDTTDAQLKQQAKLLSNYSLTS